MIVKKSNFVNKLKNVKNIVLPKGDGIQGVLIKDGKLIATNRELTIIAELEGCDSPNASFVIPQSAIPYIESAPGEEIEIKLINKNITIKSDESSTKFVTFDVDKFPEVENVEIKEQNINFNGADFKDAIETVWVSANSSSPKTMAKGILFDGDGEMLNIVACDGTRASWAKMKSDNVMNMLIPKETMKKVLPLIEDDDTVYITPTKSANKAVIKTEEYTIYTRLLEGNYIDYKALIQYPDEKVSITVNRKALIGCASRCLLCQERSVPTPAIMKMGNGYLNISHASGICEFSENVSAQFDFIVDNPEIEIGINAQFLLDCLKNCDTKEVNIHYTSPLKPLVITMNGSELRHIVVPMRLPK